MAYDTNSSKLTCVTFGAPATSINGECMDKECLRSHLKVTVDPIALLYNNTVTLSLSQTNTTYFNCITRTANGTSYATLLTMSEQGKLMLIRRIMVHTMVRN